MPEANPNGLDVSAEEERFLRSAFRRFALPYLLLVILLTAAALGASLLLPGGSSSSPDELQSLLAESASLRETIAGLREELREQSERSGARIEALEGGLAKLRAASAGETAAELGSRLDHAHQRIGALEGRISEVETSRVASPAPAPAAAAPVWSPGYAEPSRP